MREDIEVAQLDEVREKQREGAGDEDQEHDPYGLDGPQLAWGQKLQPGILLPLVLGSWLLLVLHFFGGFLLGGDWGFFRGVVVVVVVRLRRRCG